MELRLFRKIISLVLAFSVLLASSLFLFSCSDVEDDLGDIPGGSGGGGNTETSYLDKVIVPIEKNYPGRDAKKFTKIEYTRPDFDKIITRLGTVTTVIRQNSSDPDEQAADVLATETDYRSALTMYAVARAHRNADTADTKWAEEYNACHAKISALTYAANTLYSAAAASEHAEKFEEKCFGEGFLSRYGVSYTEELSELFDAEANLVDDFSYLSKATIKITYGGYTDYVDNLITNFRMKYGDGTSEYYSARTACLALYSKEYNKLATQIYTDLIKVRRLIADELGYADYSEYAYAYLGYEYSPAQMADFIEDVTEYAVPVYKNLNQKFFSYLFATHQSKEQTLDTLLNNGYNTIKNTDSELLDIYSYMLQYSLFDIQIESSERYEGAYCDYLYSFDSPLIFMSAKGKASDFSAFFRQFGAFVDSFTNYGAEAEAGLTEISALAMELMITLRLGSASHPSDTNYMKYRSIAGAMESIIMNGFYAKFEALAYKLDYEDITDKTLESIIKDISADFGLSVTSLSDLITKDTVCSPLLSQSYATAAVTALELYFMEAEEAGAGFDAYKILVDRTECGRSLEDNLREAGLTSPLEQNRLKDISNLIYREIFGNDYWDSNTGESNA